MRPAPFFPGSQRFRKVPSYTSESLDSWGWEALCSVRGRNGIPYRLLSRSLIVWLGLLISGAMVAQTPLVFSPAAGALDRPYHSGGTLAFTDVDNNGWDDLVILDEGHIVVVEYQGPQGFHAAEVTSVGGSLQWGACVGDLDNNGSKDLISGGSYDGVHFVRLGPNGGGPLEDLDNGAMFMQACAMVDLDDDGVLTLFACHDDGLSRLWKGGQMQTPTPDDSLSPGFLGSSRDAYGKVYPEVRDELLQGQEVVLEVISM